MFKTKEEVEKWLKENNKNNFSRYSYSISDDLQVKWSGTFYCNNSELTDIPVKFSYIKGNFIVSRTKLSSFKNFPDTIDGNLYIDSCRFTSLEGMPKVSGCLNMRNNLIMTLKGFNANSVVCDGHLWNEPEYQAQELRNKLLDNQKIAL